MHIVNDQVGLTQDILGVHSYVVRSWLLIPQKLSLGFQNTFNPAYICGRTIVLQKKTLLLPVVWVQGPAPRDTPNYALRI